jgi:uncharacterized membrane protein (UPF0127 family)
LFQPSNGRRAFIAAGLALAAAGAACAAPRQSPDACTVGQAELKPLQPLTLETDKGRYAFRVEDADTDSKRETGLMCRKALAADRGMLFDFKRSTDNVAFWMRNTLIPLDIVFIRPDGRVLSIARNARPLDETPLPAGGKVRAVLELAAGRAAEIGLMPGDKVVHRIFAANVSHP